MSGSALGLAAPTHWSANWSLSLLIMHAYLGGKVQKPFADMVYPSFDKQLFNVILFGAFSLHWIMKDNVNIERTWIFFFNEIFAIALSDPIRTEKCNLDNILRI